MNYLYKIQRSKNGTPEVIAVQITKETATRVYIVPCMEFYSFKTIFVKARYTLHRTEEAALEAFIRNQEDAIEGAYEEQRLANIAIEKARTLLNKRKPKKVQAILVKKPTKKRRRERSIPISEGLQDAFHHLFPKK